MANLLLRALFLLCAAAPAGAQALTGQGKAPSQTSAATYVVGSGDELKVTVFDEPQLSGTFKIDTDGTISYAILGRVSVGGRAVRDIEAMLTRMLADGYVNRPAVTVEVAQYRSKTIFIMGEVKTPGQYPLTGESTLLEVLSQAGSLTPTASDEVRILRPRNPEAVNAPTLPEDANLAQVLTVSLRDLEAGKFSVNVALQNGDTIFVAAQRRFYISGQVRNPGSFVLQRDMTVEQAIAVAGGLTERGSKRGIKIRRELKPGVFYEIGVSMTDKVQPGDTIIVRQRFI